MAARSGCLPCGGDESGLTPVSRPIPKGVTPATQVICGLCQHSALRELGRLPALPSASVLLCEACQFAVLDPLPGGEELAAYYASDYAKEFGATDPYNPKFIAAKRAKAINRMQFLNEQFLGIGGGLLEVGCAEGEFIGLACEKGFECVGIEPDAVLAARAVSSSGCHVAAAMFPCPLPIDTFDVVASFHVIEHVPDPCAFLRTCASYLHPGGVLYIATPDLENTKYEVTHHVFRPCHLTYFSAAALRCAMLASGCREAVAIRTDVCGKPELKAIGWR